MAGGFVICNKCNQVVLSDYRICAVCGNDLLAQGGSRPVQSQPAQNLPTQVPLGSSSGSQIIGPGYQQQIPDPYDEGQKVGPTLYREEEEEEKMSVSEKVVTGIDIGINIGARIYGVVLIVGGVVAAVSLGKPAFLLISAYGVYLALGGSWIIF